MTSFETLARNCALNLDHAELRDAVLRKQKIDRATTAILSVVPAFSIVAFLSCLFLCILIIFALIKRRIPSRKYSVVLSRTVADVFSCSLFCAASFMANENSASYAILALFLCAATFGFIHLSLSHLLTIVLRQLSVTRPYGFQTLCTIRRVSTAVALIWLVAILYAAAFSPLTTVVLDPSKNKDVCTYANCERPLLIVAICVIAAGLLIVPGCYCAVLFKLKSIAYSEKMHNEPEITKKKMFKFFYFGGHLSLYALISTLILIGACIILHNVWLYNTIRSSIQQNCDVVGYIDTLVRLETLAGGAVLLWLVRIFFDVVISILADYQRLFPWLAAINLEPLRENQVQVISRASPLQWQKNYFDCPIFNIDGKLHPWDFKN
ncbi:unnamed protein product [Cylicocyclus nassatus]|uniref:G-protein coupled receptors family 1 profile domain-containing protein n=1 Tax=Cylicocyclus nassatus TaxID=53992 RepID=A0AA36M7N2_CYLNA|nr:unnamed protein product [Cylicocyclus nassatus]CAJ0600635.1 unnamed protein product [Cylicocyclus nassatus]